MTEAATAPSMMPTFHLSPRINQPLPPPPKKENPGRKQGHLDENVCQRAGGIENGFTTRGRWGSWGRGESWVLTCLQQEKKGGRSPLYEHVERIRLISELALAALVGGGCGGGG